jgi:peptidoglycan/LPS O-acetylase OafA/YrhL
VNRIRFLDGFRGIAIILVLLFHAFAGWPNVVPYGNRFSSVVLFKYGWFGVELFFMISGFVILMTLEKCANFQTFMKKRWLRLFPAMLIVTVVVYLSRHFFYERPAGIPQLRDIFPGLLFIEPSWIGGLFSWDQGVLEGAFWSLFVEVKFYLIFGILYYILGKQRAIIGIGLCYFISLIVGIIIKICNLYLLESLKSILNDSFSFEYFGWFFVGAMLYELYNCHERKRLSIVIVVAIICSMRISMSHEISLILISLLISGIFISTVYFKAIQNIIANRFLIFFGFISYPLYLIHENMMISLIVKMKRNIVFIPDILLPLVPIAFLSGIAFIISRYCEPKLKNILNGFFNFLGTSIHHS